MQVVNSPDMNEIYGIDYLRITIPCNHNRAKLSSGISINFLKRGDEISMDEPYESYRKIAKQGSYSSNLIFKSKGENKLQIEGNFYKFLNGHNITGSTNLKGLVLDTIKRLQEIYPESFYPTAEQLREIRCGWFTISRIDINKAVLLPDADTASKYLHALRNHATYPRRINKHVENNGIYFGMTNKRSVIKYYYKGKEIIDNEDCQSNLTDDLITLADRMIRCEIILKWDYLKENNLLNGYDWFNDVNKAKDIIDQVHSKLIIPDVISKSNLPNNLKRYLTCVEAGNHYDVYSIGTIGKYNRALSRCGYNM